MTPPEPEPPKPLGFPIIQGSYRGQATPLGQSTEFAPSTTIITIFEGGIKPASVPYYTQMIGPVNNVFNAEYFDTITPERMSEEPYGFVFDIGIINEISVPDIEALTNFVYRATRDGLLVSF